ncbi:hypothetical protein [Nocardioides panacisoli]|uniref:Lipoprotein n=1 Tax=Nocardioides panacisoli TaxID=627624 RepID=A0ABP7IRF2_9ACTN
MPHRSPLSRRTVVVGGLGGLLVGGAVSACGSQSSGTTPAAGSDTDLVDEVGQAIADTLGRIRAARGAGLRPVVRPFARLHDAHLKKLGWSGSARRSGAPATRDDVLADERRLQAHLARAAGEADSGALAQVLASMAAAIAQQVAVTP